MKEKNIRNIGKWAFTAAAALVAVISAIKGNITGIIWPIIALGLNWAACGLEDLCDELIEANRDNAKTFDEIITANHDLAGALKEEQAKNAELQEEINKLKA